MEDDKMEILVYAMIRKSNRKTVEEKLHTNNESYIVQLCLES